MNKLRTFATYLKNNICVKTNIFLFAYNNKEVNDDVVYLAFS